MNPCRTVDGQRAADIKLRRREARRRRAARARGRRRCRCIDEAVDFATALLCADAIGAMQYANDATLEYLKTRKQFGVPIGVLPGAAAPHGRDVHPHRAGALDGHPGGEQGRHGRPTPPSARRAVSAAKVKIADAARQVSQESVQLHGGMGMTEELKISHTFRRLTMIAQRFGDADHHLERYAALG